MSDYSEYQNNWHTSPEEEHNMRDRRAARRLRLHNAFLRSAIARGIHEKKVPHGYTVFYKSIPLQQLIEVNTRLIQYYEAE